MTFPDQRWGKERAWVRGPMTAFASSTPGSWLIRTATPLDRKVLVRTKGRRTLLGPIGVPTLLLTTTGRKSGLPRTTPLLYAHQGDSLVVVGSNFGQERHPAWTGNLLADPHATVTMAGEDIPVVAELLTGDEAAAGYAAMVEVTATYREYRSRTDRDIRVFRLRRA